MRYGILGLCALVLVNSAFAGFKWEAATGYTSTDGVLEERLKQGLENPDALRLMNEAADKYFNRSKEEDARKTFREVIRRYPASLLAPEASYQIGNIRVQQGKIDKAFEAYGLIIEQYPNYADFDKLLGEMFSLAERLTREKSTKALGLWGYRDTDKAIDAFEKIVLAAPYSDYAPKALYTIAGLYRETDEELSAIDAYERLLGSYPKSPLAADAYLNAGDIYRGMVAGAPYDQGATNAAIRYYEDFVALYPDDERVTETKGKLAQMREVLAQSKYNLALYYLEKRGNQAAAASLLKETIQIAPESQSALKSQKILEDIAEGNVSRSSTTQKVLDTLTFWKKNDKNNTESKTQP